LLLFLFTIAAGQASAQSDVLTPPASQKKVADGEATETKSDEPSEDLYIRLDRTKNKKLRALQTAIVRYEGQPGTKHDGTIVDLVGVVHIGESEYYEDLNVRLSKYDSVLYELVAPDGTRIRPEDLQERRSLLASIQTGMKDMVNLEYQLEQIDYLVEIFRHADMSPQEFSEDLERRGDSVWEMVGRMMGAGIASQSSGGGDVGMLLAMLQQPI